MRITIFYNDDIYYSIFIHYYIYSMTAYWLNEPTQLFNVTAITDVFPMQSSSYEERMNALSRLIIVVSIIGYFLTRNSLMILYGIVSVMFLSGYYYINASSNCTTKDKCKGNIENFTDLTSMEQNNIVGYVEPNENELKDAALFEKDESIEKREHEQVMKYDYKHGTPKNPFSNVLLTQIVDVPNRRPAPPAFNATISANITNNIKKAIQMLNPGIRNINNKLFGSKWDEFQLDKANRAFYTMPNSQVVNAQDAFAKYLYDDLKYSSHLDTPEGAIARTQNTSRWIMM
jgi:hypothetical protein